MAEPETLYGPRASILITGASSGIGAALAEHLARCGGKIALMARRAGRLEAVAQRVRAAGGTPLVVAGDVADPAAVGAAHRRIEDAQGPIDVAFLNAGVGNVMPLKRFDAAVLRRVLEVNVLGAAHWVEALLPPMLARRSGVIVGISSISARRALHGAAAYGASKAALSYLLESLRLEAASSGVQISIVEPGFIRTEINTKNNFPMPFLVDVEPAVSAIATRVAAGEGWIRFPWPVSVAMALLRTLPSPIYESAAAAVWRRVRTRRAGKRSAPAA